MFKSISVTFLTRLAAMTVGWAGAVVIARVLGPEDRGLLSVVESYSALLIMFGSQWLYNSNIYYVAKYDDPIRREKQINNSLIFAFVGGLFFSLAFGLAFLTMNRFGHTNFETEWLFLMLSTIPFQVASQAVIGSVLGLQRVFAYNVLTFIQNVVLVFSLVLFLVVLDKGISGALGIYLFLSVFQLCMGLWYLSAKLNHRLRLSYDRDVFWQSIRYGMKMFVAGFSSMIVLRTSIILVERLSSAVEAGLFTIAFKIVEISWTLPNITNTLLFPKITGIGDDQEKNRTVLRWAWTVGVFQAIVYFGIFLLGQPVITLMFGQEYSGAYDHLVVILPGAWLLAIEMVFVTGLSAIGLPRSVSYLWVLLAFLSLGLNFWLIPETGGRGSGLALSICYSVAFFGILVIYSQYFSLKLSDIKDGFLDVFRRVQSECRKLTGRRV